MAEDREDGRRDFLIATAGMVGLSVAAGQLYSADPPGQYPKGKQLDGCFKRLGQHQDHEWVPLPWKGTFNKVLMFERCTGLTLELARIEKGATFPEHYHTTVQTQFLVSGSVKLKDGKVLTPGAFNIIPAGQVHGPFVAVEEAVTFKYFASVPVYLLMDGTTFLYREDGKTIEGGKLEFVPKIKGENFITPPS